MNLSNEQIEKIIAFLDAIKYASKAIDLNDNDVSEFLSEAFDFKWLLKNYLKNKENDKIKAICQNCIDEGAFGTMLDIYELILDESIEDKDFDSKVSIIVQEAQKNGYAQNYSLT